jgi:uncharacterized membrane protein YeiH
VAATTGGVALDLLTSRPVAVMGEGPWLLGVVACGAVIFWLITIYVGFYSAVAVTVIDVGSLRVSSVRFGWTNPFFPGDDSRDPRSEPGSDGPNGE